MLIIHPECSFRIAQGGAILLILLRAAQPNYCSKELFSGKWEPGASAARSSLEGLGASFSKSGRQKAPLGPAHAGKHKRRSGESYEQKTVKSKTKSIKTNLKPI